MSAPPAKEKRRELRWFFLLLAGALVICGYFGVYVWARVTGLFVAENLPAYGNRAAGFYVVPTGYLSLAVLPEPGESDESFDRRNEELGRSKKRSRQLWPYYSWLAAAEEKIRRQFQ